MDEHTHFLLNMSQICRARGWLEAVICPWETGE